MLSEEDRLAITELFNKKQALMVELQHYEANAANGSVSAESLERPASAMPTNTRLQVAVLHTPDEVRRRFNDPDCRSSIIFVMKTNIWVDSEVYHFPINGHRRHRWKLTSVEAIGKVQRG